MPRPTYTEAFEQIGHGFRQMLWDAPAHSLQAEQHLNEAKEHDRAATAHSEQGLNEDHAAWNSLWSGHPITAFRHAWREGEQEVAAVDHALQAREARSEAQRETQESDVVFEHGINDIKDGFSKLGTALKNSFSDTLKSIKDCYHEFSEKMQRLWHGTSLQPRRGGT